MTRFPRELEIRSAAIFQDPARRELQEHLERCSARTRVVGTDAPGDPDPPFGWHLPVRYEPLEIIAWSRGEVFSSGESFRRFLKHSKTDFLILSRAPGSLGVNPSILDALTDLEGQGLVVRSLRNERYDLWHIGTPAHDDP